jgi:ribosomal protein L37AE/L43A
VTTRKPKLSRKPPKFERPWDRERRLYQFTCSKCGKSRRQTLKRRKAKVTTCRTCARNAVDERQMTLIAEKT